MKTLPRSVPGIFSLATASLLIALVASLLPGGAALPAAAQAPRLSETPAVATGPAQELPQDWWTRAQEEIHQGEYDVTWQDTTGLPDLPSAYQAANRGQNLRTYFTPAGISVIPRVLPAGASGPPWRLELALSGHGAAASLAPAANRVEYQRPGLVETYVNDEQGLVQRLTLAAAPAEGTVAFDSVLAGDLAVHVAADGSAIEYAGRDGASVLRYGDLRATDARGQSVKAWLALGQANRQVHLGIAAATAVFPIEVSARLSAPADLPASANWTADSDQAGAWFGFSLGTAGDVNGDGYDDVIVGARYYHNGQSEEGRAFVYHGSPAGLDATAAWTAESDQTNAWFGVSVGTAGDVNGDGYDDVIVGAHGYDNGQSDEGRAFVYYGSAAGLSATANWTAESDQQSAFLGLLSVGTAGDVNGDGYDDVIVGAPNYGNPERGEGVVFVYYGSAGGLSPTVSWMAESNQAYAWLGISVSTAGDVNGDGYDDVIAGTWGYETTLSGLSQQGAAFVYYGGASGLSATADWMALGVRSNDWFGYNVGAAGDVNGDGYDDVIAGAYGYDNPESAEGGAFVYYGSATGLSTAADWTGESDQAGAYFGYRVNTAGDVNGDGYDDVIVGARYYDNPENNEGRAFVYYGSASGLSPAADWTGEIDQASANFGIAVDTAGDVNGDGRDDVIVGAYAYDDGETDEGGAFVYYGSAPLAVTLASFGAEQRDASVLVTWETVSELDTLGFNLYRSTSADGPRALLAFVPAQAPGSTQGALYTYDDLDVHTGLTYWYWIEDVSLSGATTLHGPVTVTFAAPTAVGLVGLESGATTSPALPWLLVVLAALSGMAGAIWPRRLRTS